jgi:imidazolonepropionase-like amidohydrolase
VSRPQLPAPRSGPIRLEGGTIVDPRDGSLISGRSVLVDEGFIVGLEPDGATKVGASLRRIDAAGKFIVPGYNDMHTHVLEMGDPRGSPWR